MGNRCADRRERISDKNYGEYLPNREPLWVIFPTQTLALHRSVLISLLGEPFPPSSKTYTR